MPTLASVASMAALVGGVVRFGGEGMFATSGAVEWAAAAALWWAGFVRR